MSAPVLKKISAVRTYANDLSETRAVRDHTDNPVNDTKIAATISTSPLTTIAHTTPTVASGVKQKLVFTEPKSKKEAVSERTAVADTEKVATSTKTTIPPFHTFQKPAITTSVTPVGVTKINVPTGVITTKPKVSILTNPSHGVSVGDDADAAAEATVITDTKRSQFSFTTAVTKSVSGWYQNKKDTITGKNKPKYTVPQADRRKGVIQKATSMTGRTSTADHAEVLKRLRANKQTAGIVPVTNPKILASEPTWISADPVSPKKTTNSLPVQTVVSAPALVHIPEPVAVLPVPKIEPIVPTIITPAKPKENAPVITVVPATIPEPLRPKITPVTPELPQTKPVPVLAVARIVPISPTIPRVALPVISTPILPVMMRPKITPIIPASPHSETVGGILPAPTTMPAVVIPTPPVPATRTEIDPESSIKKSKSAHISFRFQLQNIFTHTNRIVISGGIVASCIIIAGLGYRYYLQSGSNVSLATQTETVVPVFIQMTTQAEPVIATSKEVMITTLQKAATAPDSLTEVLFIDPVSSTTLSADRFFSLFNVTILTAFKSVITNVSLGAYRGEPWLLLKVTDAPTAQGGMFDWESRMSNDLSPWYGAAVVAKKTSITAFTDNSISSVDVRILQGEQKKERITYGFVAPNYILITTTSSAWLNLHEHWRTE